MQIEQVNRLFDDPGISEPWLRGLGISDVSRALENLRRIAEGGLTRDLFAGVCDQLAEHLPALSDPDMALNNLERFVAAALNPLSLGSLFERDRQALPILLEIFSTSQHLSDLLIADTAGYDLLRMTEGQPVRRETLVEELNAEVAMLPDDAAVIEALRRFKRRETLRIAYGDIIRDQRLETVTQQISHLADAIIDAAVSSTRRKLAGRRGTPRGPSGEQARFVVLGMGKLGGCELNYSSDIDLIFLYDHDGRTDGERPVSNIEFFDQLARGVVKLLTERNDQGFAYRVDLRLRPEGDLSPMVRSVESALQYYDVLGRTWERQAYVKARPVAGHLDLGREFLAQLAPWIYRRYLGLADIAGIKALKRRIDHRTEKDGEDTSNVKTGRGGIRDIEFVIQFLQLLNGGDLPELRTGNTLTAISRLEDAGCLTRQERSILEENYSFLRKIEHRLQIMFDLQTHVLPDTPDEMRRLAIRMAYGGRSHNGAREAFETEYRKVTALNRKILDHLLHDAFGDDAAAEPEVDLVLDPKPSEEKIQAVLGKYGFVDVPSAYRNLMALATEKIRFLSTRRCRHFLAAISPELLEAIGATPDPDATLVSLEKVSDSLGGKGVLWELFSFNPPTLKLYVELCASSPYLAGILTSNPGMIDELMDSLVLNKVPTLGDLRTMLADLTRAAEDLDPILHSFKNTQQLRVGVRDILGKEDIRATTGALSDIAETCLERIAQVEYAKLAEKMGQPTIETGPDADRPCELVILGMGKFGGRELNYHSDLDIVFLYEADGHTVQLKRSRRDTRTSNQHFFSELGQRIIKVASRLGPYGRLYEIDPRLRPTGRSGALATTFARLAEYFSSGDAQLWERQALCKARVVYGSDGAAAAAESAVCEAVFGRGRSPDDADAIRQMRLRLEEASTPASLKRGPGGIVDVEFLVQMLQLKYGVDDRDLRVPNTLEALERLHDAGRLGDDDFQWFDASYQFLRTVESRLRLMHTTSRNKLPDERTELDKLARLVGCAGAEALLAECNRYKQGNRERFNRLFDAASR